ncbi:hypothetical protein Q8F55_006246 [Vanrija albida]|uniref:Uncharacterized protein n=1 Tax=Vanrija albida TaxID=181172 RepID=A0ABR3PXE2_9TREE
MAALAPPPPRPQSPYSPLSTLMFDLAAGDDEPAQCQTPPLSPPCQAILLEQLRAAAAARPTGELDPEALLTAALGSTDERKPAAPLPTLTPLASRRRVSALVITTPAPLSACYGTTDDLSPPLPLPSPSDSGASASPQSEYSAMFRSASPESDSSPSSAGHGFKVVSGARARRSNEVPRPLSQALPTLAEAGPAPSPTKPAARRQPRSMGSISRPPGFKAALGLFKRGSQRSTTL